MHYLTSNLKVRPTQLEHHLLTVAQELARKNYRLGMIESYLGEIIAEWKSTRDKYRNAQTRMRLVHMATCPDLLECLNEEGKVVFTIK